MRLRHRCHRRARSHGPFFGSILGLLPFTAWVIFLPLFGLLAFRSYRKAQATPVVSSTSAPSQSPSRFGIAIVGAALGFGVGYLARPTFLGQPIPLRALAEPVPVEFASVKQNFITHMGVATAIGLVAALVLLQIIISVRKA